MDTKMLLLIIYAAGVIINALMAYYVWDRLSAEGRLVGVHKAVLVFFIFFSFGTWIYLLITFFRSLFKYKQGHHGSGND